MFSKFNQFEQELLHACEVTVDDVLKAKAGETALIITNDEEDVYSIAIVLFDLLRKRDVKVTLVVQSLKTVLDMCDDAVSMAMRSDPNMLISLSAEKMGKDRYALSNPYVVKGKPITNHFQYLIETKKSRSFWAPGVTADIFRQAVAIDYARLGRESQLIKKVIDAADAIHITTPAGMDFKMSVKGRSGFVDDGNFSKAGFGGNLPAGETYVSPAIGSCEGTVIFDGCITSAEGSLIIKDTPVKVIVENGYVTEVTGGVEAKALLDTIIGGEKLALEWEASGKLPKGQGEIYKRNARHIGELGIGLNPAATIIGNMLIDEKAYETCHLAIGANYDDDGPSLIHQDCVCKNPTIIATMPDGSQVTILDKGVLQLK